MRNSIVRGFGILSVLALVGAASFGARANAIPLCEKNAMNTVFNTFQLKASTDFSAVDCSLKSSGKNGAVEVCKLVVSGNSGGEYTVVMPTTCDTIVAVFVE